MATSFGLCRPSSGQNIYKNLNAGVYNILFMSVTGFHLHTQLYSLQCIICQCHGIPFTNTILNGIP